MVANDVRRKIIRGKAKVADREDSSLVAASRSIHEIKADRLGVQISNFGESGIN
jgi:hypothetical protein